MTGGVQPGAVPIGSAISITARKSRSVRDAIIAAWLQPPQDRPGALVADPAEPLPTQRVAAGGELFFSTASKRGSARASTKR